MPPSDTTPEEAESCRALSDVLSSAALISGAFVAPHGDNAGTSAAAAAAGASAAGSASGNRSTAAAGAQAPSSSSSSSSLVELISGLPPATAKVACLASQLLESMHRQVGHYPLGHNNSSSSSSSSGGSGGAGGSSGYGSLRRKAAHALVSSRVNERSALQAFSFSSAARKNTGGERRVPAAAGTGEGGGGGDGDDIGGSLKAQRQLCR